MRENVKKIREEVKKLASHWFQAVYEVDGLLLDANKTLSHFDKLDWDELKNELPKWNNRKLKILASSLSGGDENGVLIDDNFFFGYIFTLVDSPTALFLLDDMPFFFENNKIGSKELLDSMIFKLSELQTSGHLPESLFEYWQDRIKEELEKACR